MLRDYNISGRINLMEIPVLLHMLHFWKVRQSCYRKNTPLFVRKSESSKIFPFYISGYKACATFGRSANIPSPCMIGYKVLFQVHYCTSGRLENPSTDAPMLEGLKASLCMPHFWKTFYTFVISRRLNRRKTEKYNF